MSTKRKDNLRFCKCLLIVLLIAVCITGCGKKQVEYVEDIASNTDSAAADGKHSLKDTLAVEDSWEETIDVGTDNIGTIAINADVIIPDTDSLKVISAKRKHINNNYKKQIAEGLSDGMVYMYDEEYIPKSEWQKKIDDIEGIISTYTEWGAEQEDIDTAYQTLADYQELYEQAPADYVAAEDYTGNTYLLNYKGREYKLVFMGDDTRYSGIYFSALEHGQFLDEKERSKYSDVFAANSGMLYESCDNKCRLTLEDAESEAEEFFEIFGGGELKFVNAYALSWFGNAEKVEDSGNWYDGYCLTMYRCVDDVCVDGCDYYGARKLWATAEENYPEYPSTLGKYRLENIKINLNYEGILEFYWEYPLELGSITTDNVQLLPYEKIKDALREAAIEYNYGISRNVKYNTLELLYYRCKESADSDNYSIIPVWRLSNVEDGEITRFVMVNAIDGSYVDVKDDIS